jgi:hypothetical protein
MQRGLSISKHKAPASDFRHTSAKFVIRSVRNHEQGMRALRKNLFQLLFVVIGLGAGVGVGFLIADREQAFWEMTVIIGGVIGAGGADRRRALPAAVRSSQVSVEYGFRSNVTIRNMGQGRPTFTLLRSSFTGVSP